MTRDAANELEVCARCGQAKWVHILPPKVRRERFVLDDGHAFDTTGGQLSLAFGERTIDRPRKKPLQQKAMQKAGQKKPLQRPTRKAAKPGKRRVA